MVRKKQSPMLDYVTKMLLLETINAFAKDNISAMKWLRKTTAVHSRRWGDLDASRK